jgi:anti-anti-sigma factor
VIGELDLSTAPTLEDRASAFLRDGHDVELDLVAVPFVDSSGLRALVLINREAAASGVRVTVLEPLPEQLRRLLDVSGVGEHLKIATAPVAPKT